MENQCDIFLFFREYIDLLCKDVLPYLFEQSLTLLKNWAFVVFCILFTLKFLSLFTPIGCHSFSCAGGVRGLSCAPVPFAGRRFLILQARSRCA